MDIRVILGQGPRGEHMDREGRVKHIEKDADWDIALAEANKDGKLVIVDWFSQYCAPCKVMAPLFADLSEKYSSVVFLKVNALELMDLAERCGGVNAFPTFQLWHKGEKIDEFAGASASSLERLLIDHDAKPDAEFEERNKKKQELARALEKTEKESMVIPVHSREEFKQNVDLAAENGKLVVVLFHASWVPACKNVMRLLHKMSNEEAYANVTFLTVDFETLPEPCDECSVRAIPTFVVFKNGEKVDIFPSVSRARIEKKLKPHMV